MSTLHHAKIDFNPHGMPAESVEWRWSLPEADPALSTLTPRQLGVLSFYENAHLDRCDAPTIGHIQAALGLASSNTVACHLKALIRKGFIEIQPDSYRQASYRKSSATNNRYRLTQAAVDRLDRKKRLAAANQTATLNPR